MNRYGSDISEPMIRVGLITDGEARVGVSGGGVSRIDNLLIGKGFHWQRPISIEVEGEIENAGGRTVNILPLERYVCSVIASEMNPEAPEEFLKAHAIISRSWALGKIRHAGLDSEAGKVDEPGRHIGWQDACDHEGFDVCSDDHCQRYQGIPSAGTERAQKAVEETRGLVLTDAGGNIVDARFSKCCGGRTEIFSSCWADRDLPYLVSRDDPWCDLSEMDPEQRAEFLSRSLKNYDGETRDFYRWRARISKEKVRENILRITGEDIGTPQRIRGLKKGASGRLTEILVAGSKGKIRIGKELAIRQALAENTLYSSAIRVRHSADSFIIQGRGWGHGVGLCQIGAARMAAEGMGFRDILRFYYPMTNLTKIY